MTKHIQQGEIDLIVTEPLHDGDPASPTTGLATVVLRIFRESDRWFFDFNDSTFKAAGHTTIAQPMSELDATNAPGVYYYAWTTSAADDTYHFIVNETSATSKNVPQTGEVFVGDWVNDVPDILADTAAIDARLPADPADESVQLAAHATTQAGVAGVLADTDDIQTRLPAALVGGRMDSDVGNMQPGVITASVINAAAITAAKFATDAIDANALAASAVAEIVAALNNLSASDVEDAVWDANIVTGHGAASAAGLLLRVLGAAISTRANNPTLNALLGVPDSAGEDIPSEVDAVLTAAHDAGSWATAAALTTQQVRDAMKLAPSGGAPAAGSIDTHLDDIETDTIAIDGRLPTDPADESLQQAAHTQTQTDISNLENLSQAQAQAACDAALIALGYTLVRAGNLDNLDALISSRSTPAQVAAVTTAIQGTDSRDLTELAGAGWLAGTDTLEQIRDAITAAVAGGYVAADRTRDDQIAVETAAIDGRLPSDPADESVQLAAHVLTQAGVAAVQADTDDIQTRLPAALIGGRMNSDVGNMQANVVDATALANNAISAAKIAANAIGSTQLANNAITSGKIATDAITNTKLAVGTITSSELDPSAIAEIADGVWDEDIVTAHSTPSAAGLLLRVLGAAISLRANNATLNAILGVADALGVDLPEQINTELEVTQGHGVGPWTSGGASLNQQQVRDAMKLAPTGGAPAAGSVDTHLDEIEADTADMQPKLGTPAGADMSEDIVAIQADTDDIQTRLPAALVGGRMDSDVGNMQVGTVSPAAVATNAIDADALATDAVNKIRDAILSDSIPFPGANIDSLISSRATPAQVSAVQAAIIAELARLIVAVETIASAGSSPTEIRTTLTQADDFYNNMQVMVINAAGVATRNVNDYSNTNGAFTVDALPFTPIAADPVLVLARTGPVPIDVTAIADGVWDENIVAAHGGASSAGLLLRVLGALISTRSNNATLSALLGVVDTPGTDLPEQVNTELEVTQGHGAGPWTSAAISSDWSDAEREQIRSALGIDGTKTAAVGGQLQKFHIAAVTTVAAGSTAQEVRTPLTQVDGFWTNMVMIVDNASGGGERVARNIDQYLNTNGALTTFEGLPFTPNPGDPVYIVARTGSLRDNRSPRTL